jgi:hypothetical protein
MLWFNQAKRHGVVCTDAGERLRVDEDGLVAGQVFADRCSGTRVSFDRVSVAVPTGTHASDEEELDEARAVNVAVVPEIVPRRARHRGRR